MAFMQIKFTLEVLLTALVAFSISFGFPLLITYEECLERFEEEMKRENVTFGKFVILAFEAFREV